MGLALLVAVPLGFFLPGYLLALLLGSRARLATAFLLSLLLLFHAVFWIGVSGLPVQFTTVLAVLAAVTAVTALAVARWRPAPPLPSPASSSGLTPFAVASVVLLVVILLARGTAEPFRGGHDTVWRWDFLARQMLVQEGFGFYPPLRAEDYAHYFFTDGIAPLVSFSYWWLYAALGTPLPALTGLLVTAQYACTAALAYRLATLLFSPRAGAFTLLVLGTSLLFFRAVAIGQETGLTALALTAMVYFLVAADEGSDNRALLLAGLAAGLGALAREYGWAFVPCGLLVLLWQSRGPRAWGVFVLAASGAAGPWFVRNALLTGNPFYSNMLDGLPINTVHMAILDYYRDQASWAHWSAADWLAVGRFLLLVAPLQIVFGLPGALLVARRQGYLLVLALVVVALWLYSIYAIGYTSTGVGYSTRVLSPAAVLLSVTAGALLDRLRGRVLGILCLGLVLLAYARAVVYDLLYAGALPSGPPSLATAQLGWHPHGPVPVESQLRERLPELLPAGSRILGDNAYAHAVLVDSGYALVPVWSPEVAFLFNEDLDPAQVHRWLWERGIRAVLVDPESLNGQFLDRLPLYRRLRKESRPLLVIRGTTTALYRLPPPAEAP